ncbi:MAG: hypothetical protein AB7F51_11830, partial [Pseudorhodoplanes sp.]
MAGPLFRRLVAHCAAFPIPEGIASAGDVSRAQRGTKRSEVTRCRTGIAASTDLGTVPDRRRTVSLRFTLRRVRDTEGVCRVKQPSIVAP